jgi:hypothetical protein
MILSHRGKAYSITRKEGWQQPAHSPGFLKSLVLGNDTLNMSAVLTEAFLPRIHLHCAQPQVTRILTNFRAVFVLIRAIRG